MGVAFIIFHTVSVFRFFNWLLIWWCTDPAGLTPKMSRADLDAFLFLDALDLEADRPLDVDLLRFAISSWIMLRTDFFLPGMVSGGVLWITG